MMWVCGLFVLVVVAGYAQIDSGFPAFATLVLHTSTRTVGLAFAANTGVIVLGQMFVLKRLEGHRRTRAVAAFGLFMGATWGLLALGAVVPRPVASVLVVTCLGVFALGETLWAPSGNAIVNALAPPHLRGRYNALGSGTWQLASIIGPILSGVMLGADLPGLYLGVLGVACLVVVVLAVNLERRLTPAQNGIFTGEDAEVTGTVATPAPASSVRSPD
jgi:MFS family permease